MDQSEDSSTERQRNRNTHDYHRANILLRIIKIFFITFFGIRSQSASYNYYQNFSRIISIIGWTIAIGFFAYSILNFNVDELNVSDPRSVAQLFNSNLQSFKIAVVALLSGFAVERISMNISDMGWEARQDEMHNDLVRTVSSMSAVQHVGPSDDVHHDLSRSIKRATRVKNTFLNVGGAPRWDSHSENNILELYEHFLDQNPHNLWQDIVSVNELHSFRHTRLFSDMQPPQGEHRIAVLRSNMPIINFIIIENPITDTREAYFGWIFDRAKSLTNIYKTTDSKLIDLFDLYFDIIWNEKSAETWSVDYAKAKDRRGPVRKFVVDKAGTWVTALVSGDGQVVNNAVIRIEFGPNGPLIEGVIADDQSYREIRHTDIVNTSGQIFFEYQEISNDGIQIGFCFYKFFKDATSDVIKGYLIEPPRLARTFIYGVRHQGDDIDFGNKGAVMAAIAASGTAIDNVITAEIQSHRRSGSDQNPGAEAASGTPA